MAKTRRTEKARPAPVARPFPVRRVLLALVPGALFGLLFIARTSWVYQGQRRFTLFDDAMISMTYGRTLARGGGLVWFEGAPRVEGVTNPLWTLMMAGLHAVGLEGSSASLVVMLLSLVSVLGAAAACAVLSYQLMPLQAWAPEVSAFVAALTYPIVFWSLRGMEVGFLLLLSLWLMAAAVALTSDRPKGRARTRLLIAASLVAVAGLATRLDFAVIGIVVVAWLVWASPRAERWLNAAAIGGSMLAAAAVMTLWRWQYYGEITPNTYTLKVAGVSLVTRLQRGLITDLKMAPTAVILVLAFLVIWRVGGERARRVSVLLVAVAAGTMAYATYVGGDAWEIAPSRYVAPLLAVTVVLAITALEALLANQAAFGRRSVLVGGVLLVLAGAGMAFNRSTFFAEGLLSEWFSSRAFVVGIGGLAVLVIAFVILLAASRGSGAARTGVVVLGVLVVLFASSGLAAIDWVKDGGFAVADDQQQAERGLILGEVTKPGAKLAVSYAGAPIYYSDRAGIDLLGKSDRRIARAPFRGYLYPGHNKWDYEYSVLQLKPDIITELARAPEPEIQRKINQAYERRCVIAGGAVTTLLVRRDSDLVVRDSPLLQPC